MPKQQEVYKCDLCGNIVEVLHGGAGELVCCGQPMLYQEEGVVDAAKEKHIPVVEKTETGYKVKVGSVDHPMTDKHYIEWIEIVANGQTLRKYLSPDDTPAAEFCTTAAKVTARSYCNLHGFWKS